MRPHKFLMLPAALAATLLLSTASTATPHELLPIESFARRAVASGARMSPDGRSVAYTAAYDNDRAIVIQNLDGGKTQGVQNAAAPFWVNSDRIAYMGLGLGATGISAIDRDGNNYTGITGFAREAQKHEVVDVILGNPIYADFEGKRKDHILMLQYDWPTWRGRYAIQLAFPHVIDMNTRTGGFMRLAQNPGQYTRWLPDAQGNIRVASEFMDGLTRVVYRESEKSPWRALAGLDFAKRAIAIQGLSADGNTLYLSKVIDTGKWALFSYDLRQQQMGPMILAHDHYDILPFEDAGGSLLLAPKTREVLGVSYIAEIPKVAWFDPQMAAIQSALDKSLPRRINTITDYSDDMKRFLVFSWSDRDPGTYYTFDLAKQELKSLIPTRPWIKSETMAEMFPISYKSRDGLTIRGFLTVPVGQKPKHLPLVVLPHGGPFVREVWGFDSDVQFLANRGYAVLQMNYRGSPGFGQDFLEKGQRRVGRELLDDITDGTKWAIAKGIADPDRIAIMGWSFGGYTALMGVIREPELYRCAIDLAGVTDWKALLKYDFEVSPNSRPANRDFIGDFEADAAELDDISPVSHVDKIRVPLLLVYSKDDDTVHYDQAKLITKALDNAHVPYEFMSKFNEGHGFYQTKNRIALYERIEQFLARNMSPRAPADAATAAAAN